MAKTIEKVFLGVFLVLIFGVGSLWVTALALNKNPTLVSSIQADDKEELSDSQEPASLESEAKISSEEAKKIASGAVDVNIVGEITQVELENEDGNVVYAVEFTKDGTETDVKIDAGTGKVLLVESDQTEPDAEVDDDLDE